MRRVGVSKDTGKVEAYTEYVNHDVTVSLKEGDRN